MRLLTSLFAVIALSLCASAFAQEEETTTSTPAEEQPATTIEETPAAPAPAPAIETTPMPTERPAPAPAMTPSAKAERSAAPASSPAAKKASSPAPAAMSSPAKNMGVEATIKDYENRWAAAHGAAGLPSVEPLIADDFAGMSSKGKFTNRRSLISEMKNDKDTYTYGKNEKLDVHRYGTDVVVVVGKYREKGTGKDKQAFDRTFLFTDTWMMRKGAWKCIASQSMVLPAKK